jgi:uncharacterized secreted protein with C-terminal beta-propeller domain
MLLGLIAGCGAASPAAVIPGASESPEVTADLSGRALKTASSYDEVFKALSEAMTRTYGGYGGGMAVDDAEAGKGVLTGAPAQAPAAAGAAVDGSASAAGGDYSQTNVQVEGVDEGDIVKTDGRYIYVLRNNELIIFKADGAGTTKISSVKVVEDQPVDKPVPYPVPQTGSAETDSAGVAADLPAVDVVPPERYSSEYASDIYVTGDTLVVITSYSSYMPYLTDGAKTDMYYGGSRQVSKLHVYDITDRAKPVHKTELGQDGYVLTTRLIGKTLYMISSHYVYDVKEGQNETFIPSLYVDGTAKLVAPDTISIMPFVNTTAYTIVCAYDLENAAIGDSQTVLGGGSNVYMNAETLFIANSTTSQTAGTPYADSVYTVIDYTTTNVTDITSFDIAGGGLKMKAAGSVPGNLNSQFNMDEFEDNLRVVTTTYTQSWSEYTDKAKGFVNYIWKDPVSANTLTVLDGSLKVIGSVGDLAPGEQVYSARFDGAVGYFVTFRQVDPLFAVDLSNPAKPTVLSALKIPGFSEYLHVWSDGRLFGLGMNADPETGRTDGMKLAMFDTSDPTNVTVKHELKLTTSWSTALYNHKAILISPDKSLIAFPADSGYDIYTYSDDTGFSKRATISAVEWSGDSRGLYIGDNAYIVDWSSVSVLDMSSFKLLNRISY